MPVLKVSQEQDLYPRGGRSRGSAGSLTQLVVIAPAQRFCRNCTRRAKLLIKLPEMLC